MRPAPGCVRCGGELQPPGLMSSAWVCEHHGDVAPLQLIAPLRPRTLQTVAAGSRVPVWQLSPAPVSWTLGGAAVAGDERATTGVALGWSGPSPLGGPADLVIVAEEPGVGLGARYAGLPHVDAGEAVSGRPADHVEVRGHPTALWECPAAAGRTVLVGEAGGGWLWLVFWPASAVALMAERFVLVDARERSVLQQHGAPTPRLLAP